jgi:hypothetical protein
MHLVVRDIAFFKKLIMHLKNQCSTILFQAESTRVQLSGSSPLDNVYLEISIPSSFFRNYRLDGQDPLRVMLDVFPLYNILKRATFRTKCLHLLCTEDDDVMTTDMTRSEMFCIEFEEHQKKEMHMMACEPILSHSAMCMFGGCMGMLTLDVQKFVDGMKRFHDLFQTLQIDIVDHRVALDTTQVQNPAKDALKLCAQSDMFEGEVIIPVQVKYNEEMRNHAGSTNICLGKYFVQTLYSIAHFARMASTKTLHFRFRVNCPLHIYFGVQHHSFVHFHVPPVLLDR